MIENPKHVTTAEDKATLIKSLKAQSITEAERIRAQTESEISARRNSVEAEIQRIYDEESRRTDSQIQTMERRARTNANIEARHRTLTTRKELIDAILERSEKRAIECTSSPEYRDALINWIVEAILGLEATEVTISSTASEADLIDEILTAASERAFEVTGNRVTIKRGASFRTGSPGVIVHDENSARVFDNTIATRLRRYQSEIQRLIAERLYQS